MGMEMLFLFLFTKYIIHFAIPIKSKRAIFG